MLATCEPAPAVEPASTSGKWKCMTRRQTIANDVSRLRTPFLNKRNEDRMRIKTPSHQSDQRSKGVLVLLLLLAQDKRRLTGSRWEEDM